jgi:hypothetical protein
VRGIEDAPDNSKKEKNPMKNTLIRVLAIMTLAGSMSAFAATEKAKASVSENTATSEETKCACPVEQQKYGMDEQQQDQNKVNTERQRLIQEQERQWLQDVQHITAG